MLFGLVCQMFLTQTVFLHFKLYVQSVCS